MGTVIGDLDWTNFYLLLGNAIPGYHCHNESHELAHIRHVIDELFFIMALVRRCELVLVLELFRWWSKCNDFGGIDELFEGCIVIVLLREEQPISCVGGCSFGRLRVRRPSSTVAEAMMMLSSLTSLNYRRPCSARGARQAATHILRDHNAYDHTGWV